MVAAHRPVHAHARDVLRNPRYAWDGRRDQAERHGVVGQQRVVEALDRVAPQIPIPRRVQCRLTVHLQLVRWGERHRGGHVDVVVAEVQFLAHPCRPSYGHPRRTVQNTFDASCRRTQQQRHSGADDLQPCCQTLLRHAYAHSKFDTSWNASCESRDGIIETTRTHTQDASSRLHVSTIQ